MHVPHVSNMDEAGEKDDCQRSTVILDEFSNRTFKQRAFANFTAEVGEHKDQKGNHDRKVRRSFPCYSPLPCQNLDAFLEIDKGNIKPEDIAGESCHISQCIARIRNGKDPVQDKRPAGKNQ